MCQHHRTGQEGGPCNFPKQASWGAGWVICLAGGGSPPDVEGLERGGGASGVLVPLEMGLGGGVNGLSAAQDSRLVSEVPASLYSYAPPHLTALRTVSQEEAAAENQRQIFSTWRRGSPVCLWNPAGGLLSPKGSASSRQATCLAGLAGSTRTQETEGSRLSIPAMPRHGSSFPSEGVRGSQDKVVPAVHGQGSFPH